MFNYELAGYETCSIIAVQKHHAIFWRENMKIIELLLLLVFSRANFHTFIQPQQAGSMFWFLK